MAVCCVIRHSVGGPCQSADHYTSTNTGWSQSYFTYTISAIGAKPIQWEIFLLRHVMLSLILFKGGDKFLVTWPITVQQWNLSHVIIACLILWINKPSSCNPTLSDTISKVLLKIMFINIFLTFLIWNSLPSNQNRR